MSENRYVRRRQAIDLGVTETNKGRTRQEFKDETDINKVLGKWRRQGFTEHVNIRKGLYGDFSEIQTFQESADRVAEIWTQFMALPARLRAICDNDPEVLNRRLDDPAFVDMLEEFHVSVDEPEEGAEPSTDSGSHPEGASAEPMAEEGCEPAE